MSCSHIGTISLYIKIFLMFFKYFKYF
jgi:hypothetical protein